MSTIASDAPKFKFALVATARWEENDIVEWIEYHRTVGFEHIYLYSNDDDPMVLNRVVLPYLVGDQPFVTFRYWPHVGHQASIYIDFLARYKHEVEWFSFLDADEFFVFKGVDNVQKFMEPFEATSDAVYFNWLLFGSNSYGVRDTGSILLNYTRRQSTIHFTTKVITRASKIDVETVGVKYASSWIPFQHFWDHYFPSEFRILNVLGHNIPNYVENFPEHAAKYITTPGISQAIIDKAFVAHFQFKSLQDFQRRINRGEYNREHWSRLVADGSHLTFLQEMNHTSDIYLAKYWTNKVGNAYDFRPVSRPGDDFSERLNVAFRKPTQQSSVDHESARMSSGAYALGHGNDGVRRGSFGFHTLPEDQPWWSVDLLDQFFINEIRLYNRVETPEIADRSRFIAVEISERSEISGSEDWREIFSLDGHSSFGGTKQNDPLIIKLDPPILAQHVRIISRSPTILHLDEVEVYSVSASGSRPLQGKTLT